MQQASIWVLVILTITLAVLFAVNFWSDSRRSFAVEARERGPGGKGTRRQGDKEKSFSPSSFSPIIDNRGLVVEIQKQLPDFSLETYFTTESDTLGLLGASGAGKSMLLRCIAGLETPSWGRIVLNGRVLFDSEKGINLPACDRRIGFLFQNYALFPHLSVSENIGFGLQQLPQVERTQRVNEQITRVQLQGLENRYPQQLSGGQQQRVALARALAIQPEAILLDEPFSALDTHLRSQLEKQLIETLSTYQGVSLFVTHNLEEAYRVCKNLLVLSEGKISAKGSKEHIFEHPRTVSVAQMTGCKNFSRAQVLSPQIVEAADWGCTLRTIEPIPNQLAYVGIRAHQLTFPNNLNQENTFRCWVVQTSETPHRMTLYLKLHHPPVARSDYQLQAEVFKEKWVMLKDCPCPWHICLDPLRLILMKK